MKALFIIPGTGAGSSMIFARRLSSALANRGMEIVTFHMKTGIRQYWGELPKLRNLIGSFNPDVVVAHFGSLTGFTAALLARRRAVVIFRGSDLNPWSGPWLHVWISHVLSHIAALTANRIVCVSKELRNRLWWRRGCVDILPSGVDHELFLPMDFTSARTELGWDREDKVVLFNASNPVKRLDRALAATSLAEELLGRTVRLEILTGATEPDKIPLLMNAANCLLLVSDYEGSPTVVQEAMACQLPVVSIEVGDVREMLADVSPSWIVRPNTEEIGRALAECLCLGQTVRSDGRRAMPRCSLLSIAKELEDIFDAIRQPVGPTDPEDNDIGISATSKYGFCTQGRAAEGLTPSESRIGDRMVAAKHLPLVSTDSTLALRLLVFAASPSLVPLPRFLHCLCQSRGRDHSPHVLHAKILSVAVFGGRGFGSDFNLDRPHHEEEWISFLGPELDVPEVAEAGPHLLVSDPREQSRLDWSLSQSRFYPGGNGTTYSLARNPDSRPISSQLASAL
jgi:teichuronic acid biosynthesis glycosyltransferase TuaC